MSKSFLSNIDFVQEQNVQNGDVQVYVQLSWNIGISRRTDELGYVQVGHVQKMEENRIRPFVRPSVMIFRIKKMVKSFVIRPSIMSKTGMSKSAMSKKRTKIGFVRSSVCPSVRPFFRPSVRRLVGPRLVFPSIHLFSTREERSKQRQNERNENQNLDKETETKRQRDKETKIQRDKERKRERKNERKKEREEERM